MKKLLLRRKLLLALIILFLFVAIFVPPNIKSANAQQTPNMPSVSFFGCVSNPATCGIYFVGVAAQWILNLGVTVAAYGIQLGLQFNNHIFDSPFVQTGFSVTLGITNLGFVLGIIIIAIATILRSQSYGIKQLLWKLVAMAILVNFGLVITAPIVGFSDSMTQYFTTAVSGGNGTDGFIQNLTNQFKPQAITAPPSGGTATSILCNAGPLLGPIGLVSATACKLYQSIQTYLSGNQQSSSNAFYQTLMAVVLSIFMTVITLVTFMALAILLIVRYIALGILLILLPLAWLSWIFPNFKSNFSKWWNEFVRWTFFPPLVLFFIYLAFATVSNATYMSGATVPSPAATTNGVLAGLALSTSNPDMVAILANTIIVAALMIGGIFAAMSLSGKAGNVVVGGAKAVTGWAAGYVGKQTKKGARLAYQKAGGEKVTQHLREGKTGAVLRKIPIIGGVMGGTVSRVEGVAGRAIAGVSTNETLVEAEKRNLSKDPNVLKGELKASMRAEQQFARLGALTQMNKLSKDDIINGQTVGEFFDKNPDMVARFGQKKLNEDADIVMGGDKETRAAAADADKAQAELDRVTKAGGDTADAMKKLQDATEKLDTATQGYLDKLQKSDMPKMNVNDIFGKNTNFSRALARNLALWAPQNVAGLMPKMKSPTLREFEPMYRKELQNELKKQPHGDKILEIMGKLDLHPNAKNKQIAELSPTDVEKRFKLALESFERIISNNVTHSEREFPSAGGVGGGGGAGGSGGKT